MIKIAKFSTGRTGMNAPSSSPAAHDAPRPGALLSPELPAPPNPFRQAITDAWLKDEASHVRELLAQARLPADEQARVQALAADLVGRVRVRAKDQGAIEAFMRQYDLGSEEGVLLMCVAEALLRIPDQDTADKLIRDKLADADWEKHLGGSDSVLVNASTWGLMLTGKLVQMNDATRADAPSAFKRLVGRVGEPVVRLAVRQAMKIMGHQFVMGRTISEALARSHKGDNASYRYSFDMLGEGALTMKDALRYLEDYRRAIHAIGGDHKARGGRPDGDVNNAPGISIKLSALYPRYEHAKRERVLKDLVPGVLELAQLAKSYGIGCTVDAEESDRLELSLDIIEQVFSDASLSGWDGFGVVVQAYQKRTPYTIDHLADMARRAGRRLQVRLVKGAYWDAEIKRAQIEGYPGYPVFTRKQNTDVSYLACAKRLFTHADAIYPMFATHNAHTIAAVRSIANGGVYEHQKLHGMGDDLYAEVVPADRLNLPCRVYAPVGSHEDLLPYLVRRLLENGANSSFVNRITDERVPIADLIRDPVEMVSSFESIPHPKIPLPVDLLRSQNHDRKNSMGANLANDNELRALAEQINAAVKPWQAAPLVPGANPAGAALSRFDGFSAAWALQVVAPLLIILAGFASLSGDVARETLRQELGSGASAHVLIGGRLIALATASLLLVLALLAVSLPGMVGRTLGTADIMALVAMFAAYALYLLVFCAITIGVSARFSAARTSLVVLLGFWVVATLLAPRVAPALAESLDPTPTAPAFRAAVTEDAEHGADGHDPADKRLDALKAEMLARYQVKDVDDLPVNFRGVALEFAEANSTETYNRHFERIYATYQRQAITQRAFAALSPTLALQAVSRALARTDFPAHLAFLRGVEDYRYRLIQALNLEVKQHKAANGSKHLADIATLTRSVAYSPQHPPLGHIAAAQSVNFAILLAWVLLALGLVFTSARHLGSAP